MKNMKYTLSFICFACITGINVSAHTLNSVFKTECSSSLTVTSNENNSFKSLSDKIFYERIGDQIQFRINNLKSDQGVFTLTNDDNEIVFTSELEFNSKTTYFTLDVAMYQGIYTVTISSDRDNLTTSITL